MMKDKIYISIIVGLIFLSLLQFSQKKSLQSQLSYNQRIPHIELVSGMEFSGIDIYKTANLGPNEIARGKVSGFVAFPNVADQPKGVWQYYVIEADDINDRDGNQLFTLEEIIKMPYISPRQISKEALSLVNNTTEFVVFEDAGRNTFKIDKKTHRVTIFDANGDNAFLITNDSDYEDLMTKIYK